MERTSASLVSSSSPRSPVASNKSLSLPRARHSQSPQLNDTGFSSHRQSSSPLPQNQRRQSSRSSTTVSRETTPTPRAAVPGRFTEEWDASQRGSSIIDDNYRVNMSDIQRSTSVHSYAAGDDNQLPLRNNTLKKKSSMRRTASLGRSSSRRSNRPGSVRSFAMQSNSEPDDLHSAFYCPVPTSGTPTDVLANRFQGESCPCRRWPRLSRHCVPLICLVRVIELIICGMQFGGKYSKILLPTFAKSSPITNRGRNLW